MDKKIKTKWLKALRSGKYRQIKGKLCSATRGSHCCLGVLLEVQRVNILDEFPDVGDRETAALPASMGAGLTFEVMNELANMNDGAARYQGQRKNFEQIADYIDANL